jgi:hypothetical protein
VLAFVVLSVTFPVAAVAGRLPFGSKGDVKLAPFTARTIAPELTGDPV